MDDAREVWSAWRSSLKEFQPEFTQGRMGPLWAMGLTKERGVVYIARQIGRTG